MLAKYIDLWHLTPDGDPIVTSNSYLLPVRQGSALAMLKVAIDVDERRGSFLMSWWDGNGAAIVMARADDAVLLERAEGNRSLIELTRHGQDDQATQIICETISRLHLPHAGPMPELNSLEQWFDDLHMAAKRDKRTFAKSAAMAAHLLSAPLDITVLHGDIHHGNILDFGRRGWLAIDPKGVIGERYFEYANLFCNPHHDAATSPSHFKRRLEVVTETANLDRTRLLQWIVSWAGLSAVWLLEDGMPTETRITIAEMAIEELAD
jgi:streptomycin 6-kinase